MLAVLGGLSGMRTSACRYPRLAPFIMLAIAALMVVTYVPWLSLWILRFV